MQQLQQLQPARRHRESWLRSCSHFKPARSPLINKATIITTERRGKAAQIKWNLIKNVNLAKLVPDGSGVGCLPAGMTQYPPETGRGGAKVAKGMNRGTGGQSWRMTNRRTRRRGAKECGPLSCPFVHGVRNCGEGIRGCDQSCQPMSWKCYDFKLYKGSFFTGRILNVLKYRTTFLKMKMFLLCLNEAILAVFTLYSQQLNY